MHISSSAAGGGGVSLHILRDLMRMGGAGSTGQQVPSDGQQVGNSDPADGPPPAPPPSGSTLASATLASLLQFQQHKPSASDLADKIVSQADTDGDGSLSLDEVTSALSKGQNGKTTSLSDAFNSLDSDGDGKLSADELASGLQSMMAARHHNHGRGHAYAYGRVGQLTSTNTASTSTTPATTGTTPETTPETTPGTSSGTTTTGTTETTAPVDATV